MIINLSSFFTFLFGDFKYFYYFREKEKTASLEERITELETQNQDLRHDMESCSKRDEEHLVFTQKISDKNASIQSENLSLHAKVDS